MSPTKQLLLLLSMMIFVAMGVAGGLLNVAWTYMYQTFEVSVGSVGIVLLAGTTGALIATMASGTLIGKMGIGRVLLIAMIVIAIGLFGVSASVLWFLVLGAFFLVSLGKGSLDAGLNNFVSENYGTTSMNWLHASWGLGLTIAPFIITYILIDLEMTWRNGYLFVAGVIFALSLLILLTLRLWHITPDGLKQENIDSKRASVGEAFREPVVLLSILFFFLYGGVEIGTGQLVNTLFVTGRDISQEQSSLWISIYWGSFTLGRMLIGVIALKFNDSVLLRASLALVVAGAVLLTANLFPAMNMLALILMGSGLAGIFPILISQTPARTGKYFSAQSIGFQVGFAGLGGAIIPGIIAYPGEQFSLEFIAYGILLNALLVVLVYEMLARRYPVPISK